MSEEDSHSSVGGSSTIDELRIEGNSGSQNIQPDRNVLSPGDGISHASTSLPQTPAPISQDGHSTLRVAQVVPTPRPVTNSPAIGVSDSPEHADYSSSSESGTDDSEAERGNHSGSHRARRDHRSIRLNTLEVGQRQGARIIPHQYASIRLHQSKCVCVYVNGVCLLIIPYIYADQVRQPCESASLS